ncbi:hypothetical protein COT97_00415 [Candidatus Falkowbacteria bacterium CG10_big_fil_rev_8_21_14_0_10_39_11]|uniref:Glycosyltransferase n=1 Tax=Candidatus Falkowbacteria bacterium CG10_big_fil_rev_8_21_14_0_10_39_11 TaxID=1974565 RepID=A0A2H0V6B0_9BACT|nr:MAG: hypothetical protein COT97_00415 [Candidatus Falkowbacteria bacterium CG10_big_fil_rev_8_21_14_0_10_39_11]
MTKAITILGSKIHNLSRIELLETLAGFLHQEELKLIFTPNPEICLQAHRNNEYQNILNRSNLNLPDGFGLKIGAFLSGEKINHRHTGSDITKHLLQVANDKKLTIFVINHPNSLSTLKEIKDSVSSTYPNLKLHGYKIGEITEGLIEHLQTTKPDIIFTTHGAPTQEKLLDELRIQKIPAKIGIGVGGSFDFLTGKQTRAPQALRSLGLEWLFRLIKQPKRINRIVNAVIIFPLTCLKHSKDRTISS